MLNLLAQAQSPFWSAPNGSRNLWIGISAALILGIGLIFLLLSVPVSWRRPIVATFTFFSGLFYVMYYFWPKPIGDVTHKLPLNSVDHVGFWISDAFPIVSSFTNTL